MLKNSHFYDPLPDKYIDSAFLDRIHAFSPGWEVQPVRHDLFTSSYGFVVDYIAEVLKHLRTEDYTSLYKKEFEITSEVSTRDQTGFEKTFSGLMKIIHPDQNATKEEIAELLEFSMECRKRVRDQILRIDSTFNPNEFKYKPLNGAVSKKVHTPEEIQYPQFSNIQTNTEESEFSENHSETFTKTGPKGSSKKQFEKVDSSLTSKKTKECHIVIPENSKGWSYKKIFGEYLLGSKNIVIRDPYIRVFYQMRNLVEFLRTINELTPDGDEVKIHLITSAENEDKEKFEKQMDNLNQIKDSFSQTATPFSFEFDASNNFHARSITTDHGWKISLDRGLDIFQYFEGSVLNAETNLQEARLTKGSEITFIRT
tara:strand:+ start:1 stop:1110 length:1110 start_codon:yes stop_codon:yes gene_type:complete